MVEVVAVVGGDLVCGVVGGCLGGWRWWRWR